MKEHLADSYNLFLKYAEKKTLMKLRKPMFHQEVNEVALNTWFH